MFDFFPYLCKVLTVCDKMQSFENNWKWLCACRHCLEELVKMWAWIEMVNPLFCCNFVGSLFAKFLWNVTTVSLSVAEALTFVNRSLNIAISDILDVKISRCIRYLFFVEFLHVPKWHYYRICMYIILCWEGGLFADTMLLERNL